MINYDDTRRDITIDTIPGLRTQSRLIIREPQISDSGNYSCSASNTEPASIYVFVSKGMYYNLKFFNNNRYVSTQCQNLDGNVLAYLRVLIFVEKFLLLGYRIKCAKTQK